MIPLGTTRLHEKLRRAYSLRGEGAGLLIDQTVQPVSVVDIIPDATFDETLRWIVAANNAPSVGNAGGIGFRVDVGPTIQPGGVENVVVVEKILVSGIGPSTTFIVGKGLAGLVLPVAGGAAVNPRPRHSPQTINPLGSIRPGIGESYLATVLTLSGFVGVFHFSFEMAPGSVVQIEPNTVLYPGETYFVLAQTTNTDLDYSLWLASYPRVAA